MRPTSDAALKTIDTSQKHLPYSSSVNP